MPTIETIETESLGDRSYLVHDGQVALVIDPQRDIDRILELAARHEVTITHIFETHMHNDYLTGGYALAQATGAEYLVNAEDEVSFQRTPIRDGDSIDVSSSMRIKAIATPGHTFTHLSYALTDGDDAVGVFTGGSLLFGTTGRPDLLGDDHTDELVHHQFASAQRLAEELPDSTAVLPTHGFGSFCSSGSSSDVDDSTMGDERHTNPVFTQAEEEWVAETLAGLDAYPAYYVHMQPINSRGPGAPDLTPPTTADKETLARRLADGEWVVDLRSRTAFAAGHVGGTFNFGLDGQFVTYLGWLIPWGAPLTLLGETPDQVSEAQRELVRIGIDRLVGANTGSPEDWTSESLASFPRADFSDLAKVRHHRDVALLDVRQISEYEEEHIESARNVPLHELTERLAEIGPGEHWVHCASGYRAAIAASILKASGHRVVLIDDSFDESAASSGLPIHRGGDGGSRND